MNKLKPTQAEYRIQLAVVKHLRSSFAGKMVWTHVPNRPTDAKDGFFKKEMGVRPGVADLLFWWVDTCNGAFKDGNGYPAFGAIELKAPTGRWGNDQNRFAGAFTSVGGKYAVCRTVKEVHDTLISWGIKPLHEAIDEPDLRSFDEKKKDVYDFYAPASED